MLFSASFMNLEEAIKIHLDNKRARLNAKSSIINKNTELHIRTIESAPRDSKSLEMRIAQKKREVQRSTYFEITDKTSVELEALERLLAMVRAWEEGRPVDGYAY